MSSNQPTTPRDYASAILAEPSLDRRKLLMGRCPQEWRDWVEEHVKTAFAKVTSRPVAGC